MGRPLKIRKYQDSQVIDQGFPNDGSTNNDYTGSQPGIVGGTDQDSDQIKCQVSILVKGIGTITTDSTSTTVAGTGTSFTTDALGSGTQLWVSDGQGGYTSLGTYDSTTNDTELELTANAAEDLTDTAWFYTVVSNQGSIIRQKASRKYMVTVMNASIQDESIAQGQAYMITDASNTNWEALGAGPNAAEMDIFTALKSGAGLTTNGVVVPVATCLLVDESNPTDPNTMSVYIYDDGDTYNAERLKNHFSINFDTPYANCNPGVEFVATFFDDNGNVDAASGKTITGTENWC